MKIIVTISTESPETYRAACPGLPGCTVRGQSRAEVLDRMGRAARAYVASLDVVVPDRFELQLQEALQAGTQVT